MVSVEERFNIESHTMYISLSIGGQLEVFDRQAMVFYSIECAIQ